MRRALPGKALGFTMLEALIAVLIVAVGVLSVANLLLKSYRFTQQASYDAMGQLLAANMADRIRVNSGQVASDAYVFDTEKASAVSAPTNFYLSGGSTGCTDASAVCANAAVGFDLSEWTSAVKASLPGGRGVICHDNPAYSSTQGFNWPCSGSANDPLVVKVGWVSRLSRADQGSGVAANAVLADTASSVTATPQTMIVVDAGGDS
ncbi:type IV pilus modification protein PilV [Ralstonia solanacearum]|uniref:Putative Type IV pilus assembly protein PilV n=1 Tax=Ralstonia solanacearum (strain Po82) TaxID=1031711 RepID=F6G4X5_RALS8|nr:type IV pilus modification protein PilV [Ralstonia solanacearum]AEG69930.1 putative Type IV pilus assembly protein PilV [Ralstonia solanacearum Po82]AMP68090.1 pilus assembly protein PilV [Ralstonia solanacearum]AMP75004.1 pilus assembly protein PilV [Ralstonia solanacearum]AYB61379.1 type IV pilus modification protein PilV [Ralstonia solanacearum]MBB6585153.1 type IV pilus modification protein PilV [Ralstonia solanacearum]